MEGPLRVDLDVWIAFAGQAMSDSLKRFQNRMAMVRANELSVEVLHKQGKLLECIVSYQDVGYFIVRA